MSRALCNAANPTLEVKVQTLALCSPTFTLNLTLSTVQKKRKWKPKWKVHCTHTHEKARHAHTREQEKHTRESKTHEKAEKTQSESGEGGGEKLDARARKETRTGTSRARTGETRSQARHFGHLWLWRAYSRAAKCTYDRVLKKVLTWNLTVHWNENLLPHFFIFTKLCS